MAHEPVSIKQLAKTTECDESTVELALFDLKRKEHERGIRIQQQEEMIQLVTAPELAEYVEQFLGVEISSKLSTPALETLAIVAYRQPITRPEIEAIRGVNSDGVLRTLLSKGLVEEVGRLDSVGHPMLFGTTFEFLQFFGLDSLESLPELEIPNFEAEADRLESEKADKS